MAAPIEDIALDILDNVDFEKTPLREILARVEDRVLALSLERWGTITHAAKKLGISRTGFHMRKRKIGRIHGQG